MNATLDSYCYTETTGDDSPVKRPSDACLERRRYIVIATVGHIDVPYWP